MYLSSTIPLNGNHREFLCSGHLSEEDWLQVKYGGASVVVQIIDICNSCHENKINLLQPQLYSLSSGINTQTGAEDIPVSYRQVRHLMLPTSESIAVYAAVCILCSRYVNVAYCWHTPEATCPTIRTKVERPVELCMLSSPIGDISVTACAGPKCLAGHIPIAH